MKKIFAILVFAAILSASDDMKALEKSCDDDKAEDCVYLGFLAGARHDYKNANKLYAKACELGDAMGCQHRTQTRKACKKTTRRQKSYFCELAR